MHVTVDQKKVFELLDVLLARWKSNPKQYPYDRPDAILPQAVAIPQEMRRDKELLANFYFYSCIYMRGGIESLQAFNALVRMWRTYPHFFDPNCVQWLRPQDVQAVLKEFIGWNSRQASINWVENSRRLVRWWGGRASNLYKNLRTYKEALRRMRNKRTQGDLKKAGKGGGGFLGFQPKMVSMLVYFFDYEKWLEPRFYYPSPADFHNFRLGLATEAIVVDLPPGRTLSASEKLSAPWRKAVMAYIKARNADPVELADSLWLYSLLMCGNSPVTLTKTLGQDTPLLSHHGIDEGWEHERWVLSRKRVQLEQTCLVCPFLSRCKYGIPAQPYYRKGKLILRLRPKVEELTDPRLVKEPRPSEVRLEPATQHLLHLEHPSSAP